MVKRIEDIAKLLDVPARPIAESHSKSEIIIEVA